MKIQPKGLKQRFVYLFKLWVMSLPATLFLFFMLKDNFTYEETILFSVLIPAFLSSFLRAVFQKANQNVYHGQRMAFKHLFVLENTSIPALLFKKSPRINISRPRDAVIAALNDNLSDIPKEHYSFVEGHRWTASNENITSLVVLRC